MGWRRVAGWWACVAMGCATGGDSGPGVSTATFGGSESSGGVAEGEAGSTPSQQPDATMGTTTDAEATTATPPDESESSAGSGESDSSAGPTPEVCDGEDNDGDGLVDEIAPEHTECNDCALLQHEQHAYWACDTPLSWLDARARCMEFGADLASVHDAVEDAFLIAIPIPKAYDGRWLGGTDSIAEGIWAWSDGTPWDYDGWGVGEPNNWMDLEHHLEISTWVEVAGWADRPDTREIPYACKAPHPQ